MTRRVFVGFPNVHHNIRIAHSVFSVTQGNFLDT
jgi:hypothetical protein